MRSNIATTFPSHLIDPKEKGRSWILNYIKAAWLNSASNSGIFYYKSWKYQQIKDYAFGRQSVNQYKKMLGVSDDDNTTWINIDWRVIPIITKFRRIALNKVNKINYSVEAVAVDSMAVDDKQNYIAEQKVKLAAKEKLREVAPEMVKAISNEDDAEDYDDLKIKELYTYKHNASVEMEIAVDLIFNQNKIDYNREKVKEDLFDYGVSGYKDWIDSAGNVRFRRINPEALIINYCKENDFSDKQYVGEVIRMTISDLKQAAGDTFTEGQYIEIANTVKGKFGNPTFIPARTQYSNGYDDFHIEVLDMEFYSVNESVYEKRTNSRGNNIFGRTDYNKRKDTDKKSYKRVAYKVVYEGSWVIGTDYIFNYGLSSNMKRAKGNMSDVEMSYHLYAPELNDMESIGITEQLIPIANAIQIAWYRLQNAINQARPKGVEIDIDGIEDIPLGSGGQNLTPAQVIDLFNETGTLVYRRRNISGELTNYRPIQEIENGLGRDVVTYYDIIQRNIQMIRDITGLNEFTDGSTPDARTLTTVANMAAESSNNALGDIVTGDQKLLMKLAESVVIRIQDAVQFGNIEGYRRAIGSSSIDFIKATSDISAHEFGIFMSLSMSEEERAQFKAELKQLAANGIIDPEAAITIGNIKNVNQAEQVLAYIMKRKRDRDRKESERLQQLNAQVQSQSAQAAEAAKQQTLQIEIDGKLKVQQLKSEYELKVIDLKYQYEMKLAGLNNDGKVRNTAAQTVGKLAQQEQQVLKNEETQQ